MKRIIWRLIDAVVICSFFLLFGCPGALGDISAKDPTEKGLSYVAAAIVTAAIIRAIFNK